MLEMREKKTSRVIAFELKSQKSLCQWNGLLEPLKSDLLDLSENFRFKIVSEKGMTSNLTSIFSSWQ